MEEDRKESGAWIIEHPTIFRVNYERREWKILEVAWTKANVCVWCLDKIF